MEKLLICQSITKINDAGCVISILKEAIGFGLLKCYKVIEILYMYRIVYLLVSKLPIRLLACLMFSNIVHLIINKGLKIVQIDSNVTSFPVLLDDYTCSELL